jgi:predicted DNA-binding transcriptional regulator YafY
MEGWSFLTKHGRVLLCIAHDPGVRLRDIAASVGITERSAYAIVTDLAAAGYAVKRKDGRRNRYQIQAHMPLPDTASQHLAIGEVLALLAGASAGSQLTGGTLPEASAAAGATPAESGGVSA